MKPTHLLLLLLFISSFAFGQQKAATAKTTLEEAEVAFAKGYYATSLLKLDEAAAVMPDERNSRLLYLRVLAEDNAFTANQDPQRLVSLKGNCRLFLQHYRDSAELVNEYQEVYQLSKKLKSHKIDERLFLKARKGDVAAALKAGELYRKAGKYEQAIEWYTLAADKGNKKGINTLALLYEYRQHDWILIPDRQKALYWYQKAVEIGNKRAMYSLGKRYLYGEGVPQDEEKAQMLLQKALVYFQRSASKGNADAMLLLGKMHELGAGVEKDNSNALTWYQKAGEKGNARALNYLGNLSKDNNEYQQALAWYQKGADKGSTWSVYNIGLMYFRGEGVTENTQLGQKYLEKAAAKGNSATMDYLGIMYLYGWNSATPDVKASLEWYLRAADHGVAEAMHSIGNLYTNGTLNKKNGEGELAKAFPWYLKAAENGVPEAMGKVGHMYYHGTIIKQDYKKALEWFLKAIEQEHSGDYILMYYIADMYRNGKGVEKNQTLADQWEAKYKAGEEAAVNAWRG